MLHTSLRRQYRLPNLYKVELSNVNRIARNRLFSSKATSLSCIEKRNPLINPWFITGFTDGYGCFTSTIVSNLKLNTGWGVKLVFKIALSKKDIYLLESIQKFFSVGKIYIRSQSCQLRIESAKDLKILISHFDRFGLITQKRIDFLHRSAQKVFAL